MSVYFDAAYARIIFILCAICCFLYALFSTWRDERFKRINLEKNHGPLLSVSHLNAGLGEQLKITNYGDQAAFDLYIEDVDPGQIQLTLNPEVVPNIIPGSSESRRFTTTRSNGYTSISPLAQVVLGGNKAVVVLRFKNERGTSYKITFDVKAESLGIGPEFHQRERHVSYE